MSEVKLRKDFSLTKGSWILMGVEGATNAIISHNSFCYWKEPQICRDFAGLFLHLHPDRFLLAIWPFLSNLHFKLIYLLFLGLH